MTQFRLTIRQLIDPATDQHSDGCKFGYREKILHSNRPINAVDV
jgi:hypothetical protein